MSKLKQILDYNDMVGKTITGIQQDESIDDLYIKFSDGSFAILDIQQNHDRFSGYGDRIKVTDYKTDETDINLVDLGIITKEEHQVAIAELKLKEAERLKELRARIEKEARDKDLELLRELKEKYGEDGKKTTA